MSISSFYTAQTSQGTGAAASGKPTLANPAQVFGLNFIDFLLARALNEAPTGAEASTDTGVLQSANPLLNKEAGIDIVEMLAGSPEIAAQIKATSPDLQSQIADALAQNQQALDDILKPLTDGIITAENIQNGSPRLMQALLIDTEQGKPLQSAIDKLKQILDKLEQLGADANGPGLALTNLTPKQITDLKNKIKAFLEKNTAGNVDVAVTDDQKNEFNDIYLGLIKLIAPQARADLTATGQEPTTAKNDLIAQLNALTSGKANGADANGPGDISAFDESSEAVDFGKILKDASGKKAGGNGELAANTNIKSQSVKPDGSTLQGWPFFGHNPITTSSEWSLDSYDGMGGIHSVNAPITSPANLTNLVTQSSSASQPHPATAMVAATLQKAASTGDTRNITLQLDPPELGRIEIKMSFEKDKTVKAVLTAEKQETFSMLQRDAHALERALQNAGLNPDGSSLSFELADQGYDFNHQAGHDGSGGHSRGGANEADDIIQSTMTWSVDPETGHMHYNILA